MVLEKIQKKNYIAILSSLFLGLIASFCYTPHNISVLFFITFPLFILLLFKNIDDNRPAWRSFVIAWAFGFGQYIASIYWISYAFLVDAQSFAWFLPIPIVLLPAVMAIFCGLPALLTHYFKGPYILRYFCFSSSWFLFEYIRGKYIFSGFPWSLTSHIWDDNLAILQVISYTGSYGLSLLTALVAALPVILYKRKHLKLTIPYALIVYSSFAFIWLFGQQTLDSAQNTFHSNTHLRLVQPNIEQKKKWDKNYLESNLDNLIDLSLDKNEKSDSIIIWPETASTFYLNYDWKHLRKIKQAIPKQGYLMTGSIRVQVKNDGESLSRWNSLLALDNTGSIISHYDKVHLVPFGEYLPLKSLFSWMPLVTEDMGFQTGDSLKSIEIGSIPAFSPLICFEVIFSGDVVNEQKKHQTEWILNITNDAWYGDSPGPYQHLAISRLRAIEEGLPLIRVANTGISAVIDPWGRVLNSIPLNKRGYIDTLLPQKRSKKTFFSNHKNTPVVSFGVIIIIISLLLKLKSRKYLQSDS